MCGVGLGHNQQARGIFVEAVDDAGPPDAADAGKARTAMGDERIDERACCVTGGRMDNEAGWLVNDDERFVLENDAQRHVLAFGLGGLRRRHRNGDGVSLFDPVTRLTYRPARDFDAAGANKPLQTGAGKTSEPFRQQPVQPRSALLG